VGPITVKLRLTKGPGVVTFDDAKTDVATLTGATAEAGYPSTVTGSG
jgi:copper chaperone CopZ